MAQIDLEIRKLAYELWERDGRPDGKNLSHWLEAEHMTREAHRQADLDEGLEETFPASDTPASLMRASSAA